MKKLLYIILLLPLFAQAQTNGTIQKTSATGTIRGSFGSLGLDTLVNVNAPTNGFVPVYNSTLKKSVWTNPSTFSPTLGTSAISLGGTANGLSYSAGNYRLHKVTATTGGVLTTGTDTISGLKKFYSNISLGTTGTAGMVSFMRSLDGVTASNIEQFGDNTLRLTSSGGTKQIDLISDAANISGVLKFPTSSATLAAGDMGYNSTYGQYLRGKTGSTDDWALFAAGGGYVMHNPTGTNGVAYAALAGSGDVIVGADNNGLTGKIAIGSGLSLASGTLTATGGSAGTINGSGTSGMITKFTGSGTVGNSIMTEAGSAITVAGSTNVTSSVNGVSGGFSNSDATNGYGVKILSEGSASGRYALTLKNIAETQTYLHVSTETASKGSVVVGSATPWTGLSSHGFTVNGTSYGSIGLNVNDVNKGYLTGYTDGLILQPVGKLVLANNAGNVLIGTTTDDGVNKFQVTGNTAITGNISATNLSGTNTGNNATNTTSNTYADGKVADNLTASTTVAPSKTAVNTALALKADLASPALTGNPTAPTQTAGDNSTKIATTAYVDGSISSVASSNTYTPTPSAGSNSVTITPRVHMYTIVGKIVTVYGAAVIDYTSDNTTTIFSITLPAGVGGGGFPNIYSATGSGVSMHTSNVERTVLIDAISSTSSVTISSTSPVTLGKQYEVKYSFMYKIN